jgi:NAD(P)-dependent dehydrogenase (short-subunit alcohol dehydrogenase family)
MTRDKSINNVSKKNILFVGASGVVAEKVVPALSERYRLVGVSRKRTDLSHFFAEFLVGDLTSDSHKIFLRLFRQNLFDSIIWNPVIYSPSPALGISREKLRDEIDVAVGLPAECVRIAVKHGFLGNRSFVLVTSQLAFGVRTPWCSYSIVKRGQIVLGNYLAEELRDFGVVIKMLALGVVSEISEREMSDAFCGAIENLEPEKQLYTVG